MSSGLVVGALLLLGAMVVAPLSSPAAANPFSVPSTLPYQAPRFDIIKDGDYQPALEEGIRQERLEMETIANNPAAPTFDNTIVAMEKAGSMLERTNAVFNAVLQANTDPTLDKVQTEEAPELAAEQDTINHNPKLFARIKSLYDARATLKLDAESLQLLSITYQNFVHAGANLSDRDKARMEQIDKEEAELMASFQHKLVAATKAGVLVVSDKELLAGLPDTAVATASSDATERGFTGKWAIPLQNTTQQPALTALSNRATREKLFDRRWTASEKGDANDTRPTIVRLAQLRAEKAKLLGYPNFAAYVLYDQMARTPEAVSAFIGQLVPSTAAKAADEVKLSQEVLDREGPKVHLEPWDFHRYADQVKKQRFDVDDNEIKPYFELHTVLEEGVFYAAHELYGVTFKRRTDIPVYQSDVMVYEVFDKDGSALGLAYFDYFKRDNKSGGAWCDVFVGQSRLLGTKPVIYNVANFTKPAAGQPALLSMDDVTGMFHEFGHGLHALFAAEQYPSLSGLNVARDFVEFPSQFNEHWALYPAVLKHYAINRATGQVIPDALVDKIRKARSWGQGYSMGERLAAAELDMKWHTIAAAAAQPNVDSFETQALHETHTDFPDVPPRYRSSYFNHIWAGGYAAGYYAYLWTEMLDDDAFAWMVAHGGLRRENGQRFRDMVLSRGHTEDYGPMFRSFYGKDPDIGPMLEQSGLAAK